MGKNCRHIQWWGSRNELYVGYAGGLLTIYKTDDGSQAPICSMKCHGDDITGFNLMADETALVTISKDKGGNENLPGQKFVANPDDYKKQSILTQSIQSQ